MKSLVFLLLVFCTLAFAEDEQQRAPENMVYSKGSGLTVENLNKAVEILRDPTVMNDNFRKALSRLPNNQPESVDKDVNKHGELLLPEIEMVGKVISEDRPSTVVFKAKGKYFHFEEGESLTKVVDHKVVTFTVVEISKARVRVLVMPFNQTLIF